MKTTDEPDAMLFLKNSAVTLQQAISWRLRMAKEMVVSRVRGIALVTVVGLTGLSGTSNAQLTPEWVSRVPVGNSLSAGTAGIYVDPDGVFYITGTSGASPNTDITTVSFAPDGSTRWTQTFGSPGSGADIASGDQTIKARAFVFIKPSFLISRGEHVCLTTPHRQGRKSLNYLVAECRKSEKGNRQIYENHYS